jgi:dCTP deaminase
MPLSDTEIRAAVEAGDVSIAPFDEDLLQPASYDLRIGRNAATVPKNGDPRVNLEEERVLFVPGYAPAVIWTMEEISIPLNMVGHFGVKSGLARRGLHASIGMQIDPGFVGPLSVTLMNLTPNAVALNYGDTFLTLELERLNVKASRGYAGEYQNRKTFTAQDLEAVMGFKGHALSDVVHGFEDIKSAIESVAGLSRKFDAFLDDYSKQNRENSEFNRALVKEMRQLVEHILGQRVQTVVLRSISREQAKREILDLYRTASGPLFYSDVSERLQLDLELVIDLCTELENEGHIGVLNRHEPTRPKKERG